MKSPKTPGIRVALSLLLYAAQASLAADSYDGAKNVLTIASVAVGGTLYSNVTVTVASVIGASTQAAADSYDTYDAATGRLSIPVVTVGSTTYYNAVVTVGSVLSVGAACSGVSACYDAIVAAASPLTWSYLGVITSGNGLGNVSDASLVQTSTGAIRVYFKNGNDPQSNLAGFDNQIHSAISSDGGLSWIVESGVRLAIGSPAEVLPKTGGGYQAWGWNIGASGDPMYYAESTDGLIFTQVAVAGLDRTLCKTTSGDATAPLGDPAIVRLADGTWLLHAQGSGFGNTGPNFSRWACVATSPDGKTWTPVQSRSYGGNPDVETNPNIYLNKSGKVEWWWPTSAGNSVRVGDGVTFGDAKLTLQGGDPERLDLADGTELVALGGFDNRSGGALIFAKRATSSYTIAKVQSTPDPGTTSPNAKVTWQVTGATEDKISVMNLCLNKNVKDLPGATVSFSTSGSTITVVARDPNNAHSCAYIMVGPEKILG